MSRGPEPLSMLAILAAIEKHGPMTVETLAKVVPLTNSGIYQALMRAYRLGLLARRRVKTGKLGRWQVRFYRTQKPYVDEGAIQHVRVVKRSNSKPFRHWMDAALFGEYRSTNDVSCS